MPSSLVVPVSAQKEHLRVGIFPFAPMNYLDQDNEAQGLNPSLFKKIAEEQGWQLTFVDGSWAEGLERLQTGEIDLVMSAGHTEERARVMDYTTQPTLELWGQVFVQEGVINVNISDLAGKLVGRMRNDISGQNFIKAAENLGVKLEYRDFENFSDVFSAVKNGEVFAGVAPQHFGLRYAKEFDLVPSSIQFSPFSIYFVSKKGQHTAVLKKIDETLIRWKKDKESFYYSQLSYWLGAQGSDRIIVPMWIKYSILVLSGLCLLLFPSTLLLAHRLNKETADLSLANDELKMSRENYHSLYNNAQVGILRSRINDGKVLECNKMVAEMLGYESPEECLEKCFMPNHHVDPDFRKTTIDHLKCHGRIEGLETEFTRCNGQKFWIRFSARLYPKDAFIEMVCTDITEYRQSTLSLAKSEAELLAIYHGTPGLMLVIDDDHKICKANNAALEFCLYSEDEMLGKRPGELFGCTCATAAACGTHPECENCLLRLTVLEAIDKGEAVRRKEATLRQNSDNGVLMRHLLVSVSPLQQGQQLHTLICLEDITDIKNAQFALIESEERFRTLFDGAGDAIFLIDSSGQFIDVNQLACEALGYSKAELLKMKLSEVDAIYEDRDFIECLTAIENGDFPYFMDRVHRSKNGRIFEVEVSSSPIVLQKETFTLSIARDMILRKSSERELIASETRYTALYNQFNALLNAISDPLILLTSDMQTVWTNAANKEINSLSEKKRFHLNSDDLVASVSQCILTSKVVEDVISTPDKRM